MSDSVSSAPPQTPLKIETLKSEAVRKNWFWLLMGFSLILYGLFLQGALSKIAQTGTLWIYRAAGYLGLALGILIFLIHILPLIHNRSFDRINLLHREAASRLGISEWQLPLAAGGLCFAILSGAGAGDRSLMFHPAAALAAWGCGIVMTVAGFRSRAPAIRNVRSAAVWAGLFFIAALLLRLVRIDLPPFSGDEGSTGMDALIFLQGYADTFFRSVGFHPFPGFYYFLEAESIQLFGRTVLAVRLPSAVAGALTVGVLYLAARALFGHPTGWVAAFLLTVSPFHIVFSHIGHSNIWDALGYTAFVGALWVGWKNEHRNAFLLAGVGLGLSQFFYATSRLLWILAFGAMIVAFALDRARFRRNAGGWMGMWISAFVTTLPIFLFMAAQPVEFNSHYVASSIFRPGWLPAAIRYTGPNFWAVAANQLLKGFGAYTFFPSPAWYKPGTPLLRPMEAAFFLCGLVLLAQKPRDLRSWLILGWVGLFGLVGTLSESVPSSQRYIGSAPACALLAAFALVHIRSRLSNWIPSVVKWAAVFSIAAILFMAADNLHFAFAEYFPNSRYRGTTEFEGAGVAVANGIVALLRERVTDYEVVCLTGGVVVSHIVPSELFLIPSYQAVFFTEPYGSPGNPALESPHLLFIIPSQRAVELPQVMADLPGGTPGARFNWDGTLLFLYYDVTIDESRGDA
ncbi:MAG: glycosyltransferase family 39 protein [Anaerolineales bacterium]